MAASLPAQIAAILACGLLAGVAANTFGPRRIPWRADGEARMAEVARAAGVEVVSVAEAAEWSEAGSALFLDARSPDDFRRGRIPWSLSVPWAAGESALEKLLAIVDPDDRLVVYCRGLGCDEGILLARQLRAAGIPRVVLLPAGYDGWTAAGLAVQSDIEPEDRP